MTDMNDMNTNIIKLREDVELIKNILISEGKLNEETKSEIEQARQEIKEGNFYTEEEAREILNF